MQNNMIGGDEHQANIASIEIDNSQIQWTNWHVLLTKMCCLHHEPEELSALAEIVTVLL